MLIHRKGAKIKLKLKCSKVVKLWGGELTNIVAKFSLTLHCLLLGIKTPICCTKFYLLYRS